MNANLPYGTSTPLLPGYRLLAGTPADEGLWGSALADQILAGLGADSVFGGGGDDVLYGGTGSSLVRGQMAMANAADGADLLCGEGGHDLLDGGAGNDTLRGGTGDDTLIGGQGVDVLAGGAGLDRFVFGLMPLGLDTGRAAGQRDTINDFQPGEDLIDLTGYRGDLRTPQEALEYLGSGPMAATPHGAVRWEIRGGNTLIQLDLDLPWQLADGVVDAEILLRGTMTLTAGDFLL
ncbi:calcium-binding protein [Siccirubricoccus sp. G192]|uniref:calcium-binding protein n=1 Tax=Siccirubricoccus sp. G192 TaxID=2849651 RepID=UPI001C2BE5C2|nr:hypothetical protein [Siccirubricoccus sp. G192]MBV1798032.1 hypothetical protein [Siccirubricoccus sp. G192]